MIERSHRTLIQHATGLNQIFSSVKLHIEFLVTNLDCIVKGKDILDSIILIYPPAHTIPFPPTGKMAGQPERELQMEAHF